jgi:hypothetical protein
MYICYFLIVFKGKIMFIFRYNYISVTRDW